MHVINLADAALKICLKKNFKPTLFVNFFSTRDERIRYDGVKILFGNFPRPIVAVFKFDGGKKSHYAVVNEKTQFVGSHKTLAGVGIDISRNFIVTVNEIFLTIRNINDGFAIGVANFAQIYAERGNCGHFDNFLRL